MGLLLHHNPGGTSNRRVFIALPSYGDPNGITAFSLFVAHPALIEAGYDVELCLLQGDCHVDDARNRLVHEFLKSSCDDLVFIDADVGFQAKDLVKLLSYDRDVVGGTYPKRGVIEEYPAIYLPGQLQADKEGLLEVAALPAGFLRIRRNVLETLAKDAAKYIQQGDNHEQVAQIFERQIRNGTRVSSDYVFCRKWRDTGGKIFVDPRFFMEHRGQNIWSGTLGSHLKNLNGLGLLGVKKLTSMSVQDVVSEDDLFLELALEWGNMPWAAQPDFIKAAVMIVKQVRGPVLEMGSGISTLAMAAANPEVTIHALEHDGIWASKIQREAERLGLPNIVVHYCPMKDYESGNWYDPPELPWTEFQMVLCDGPPREGANRNILFEFMARHGCEPRVILVDDAHRNGIFMPDGYGCDVKGLNRKFAVGMRQHQERKYG